MFACVMPQPFYRFFPFVHVIMSVVSGFDDLVQLGADPYFFFSIFSRIHSASF